MIALRIWAYAVITHSFIWGMIAIIKHGLFGSVILLQNLILGFSMSCPLIIVATVIVWMTATIPYTLTACLASLSALLIIITAIYVFLINRYIYSFIDMSQYWANLTAISVSIIMAVRGVRGSYANLRLALNASNH